MQRVVALAVASILALVSAGTRAADLVVWWEKGFYQQEDEAVREIIAAFEDETGKQVELVQPTQREIDEMAQAALEAEQPPDFLFMSIGGLSQAQWAYGGHLADLEKVIGASLDLFDEDAVQEASWRNPVTGERTLYALPMGRLANHVHVWSDLLEQAGFTLADVPETWEAFWSFWCDQVQPALGVTAGLDEVWAVGLPMSIEATTDTLYTFMQFQLAYDALWLDQAGRLRIDNPKVRAGIVEALDRYTEVWRKGCTPPGSLEWTNADNNRAFFGAACSHDGEQHPFNPGGPATSASRRLFRESRDHRMARERQRPASGHRRRNGPGRGFRGRHARRLAEELVRFLVEDGWLAHWLSFAGDRYMPPMRKLTDQPFWLDPADPHRMRAAMQILSQPQRNVITVRGQERKSNQIRQEAVWNRAVHRVVADRLTPEQAVDEAVARIKQILAE